MYSWHGSWFVFFIGVSHGIPVAGAILFLGIAVVGSVLLHGAMMDLATREREVLLGVLRQLVEAPVVKGSGLGAKGRRSQRASVITHTKPVSSANSRTSTSTESAGA